MTDKIFNIFFLTLFTGGALFATPLKDPAVQEMRLALEQMGYKLHSQEIELQLMLERAHSLESTIASLKQELKSNPQEKGLEKRIVTLEKAHELLIADFKMLKAHANEVGTALSTCQSHLNKIDKQLSSDIQSLKSSMNSMLALLQDPGGEKRVYIVQSGDSLGQIALDHKTEIKTLKKLNNLNTDIIYSGQKLVLP